MRLWHEMTDAQWDAGKDLIPGKAEDPGRTAADNRLFINAVLVPPAMVVPLTDLQRLQHHRQILSGVQHCVRISQLLHHLLRTMPLSASGRHRVSPRPLGLLSSHTIAAAIINGQSPTVAS